MKYTFCLSALAVVAVAFVSCKSSVEEVDYTLSPTEEKIVDAENDFSIRLFKNVSKESLNKNFSLSTAGITYSLNMLNNGCSGKSIDSLHENIGKSKVNRFCARKSKANESVVANMNWGEENPDYQEVAYLKVRNLISSNRKDIDKSFVESLKDYYSAEVYVPGERVGEIDADKWVKESTGGMIKHVDVSQEPNAVNMINAVCLNAAWADKACISDSLKFQCADGSRVLTQYIDAPVSGGYSGANFSAAKFSLYGFSYVILMPNEGVDFNKFVAGLSYMTIKQIKFRDDYDKYDVSIPCFRIDSKVELSDKLRSVGITDIFDKRRSCLDGIFPECYVNAFTQTSVFDVRKEGISASAVTYVSISELSQLMKPKTFVFHATRPFVFYVKDYFGNIVFVGQYCGKTE